MRRNNDALFQLKNHYATINYIYLHFAQLYIMFVC